MAKDYATRIFATARAPKKKRWRIELFFIPAILLVCLLGYGIYIYRVQLLAENAPLLERVKGLFKNTTPSDSHTVDKTKKIAAVKVNPEPKVHFDFYSELPTMQMTASYDETGNVVQKAITPLTSHVQATKPVPQYMVLLGEFKDSLLASQRRLSLMLAGCDAEVVMVKTATRTIYRVQRGPFIEEVKAKKLQQQLLQKGVESTLVKA